MSNKSELPGTITVEAAADLLGVSSRRVQQLAGDGYIHKAERGTYVLKSVVQGYVRFLKEEREGDQQNAAKNRITDAKTKAIEIRNAREDHTLIELSEAEAVIDEIASMLKLGVEGVPATVTRDLPMRRKIESALNDVFAKVSARIAETFAALAASGEAMAADAEDDA